MLATQLSADPTRKVRVFLEDPARLSAMSARIDSTLWVQPLVSAELWKWRLAEVVYPADNIVCLDGFELPTRYRERVAYGAGSARNIHRVWLLGNSPEASIERSDQWSSNNLVSDVVQDEAADGLGIIRSHRSTADMRARWKAQSDLTQATLEGLGLRGPVTRGSLIFLCWDVVLPSPVQLCRMLEKACEKPVLLIMATRDGSQLQTFSCAGENLSCQNLRAPGWSQLDELVWGSDLVFCHQRDIAYRAMEAGTPMLWLREESGLFHWYFEGLDPGFKRSISAVAYHFRNVGTPSSEMLWLLNHREALEDVAKNVARRFAQAPQLADSLPTLGARLSEQARVRHRGYKSSQQPTTPMGLPGS